MPGGDTKDTKGGLQPRQDAAVEHGELSHIIEEFNIFKLEGLIFDLTRRHDRYRSEVRKVGEEFDENANPVTIEPHPNYGRPGVGAFKALQVVFYKLTEEGHPFPETVSFTRREFERLRGSVGQGGYQMSRTYNDLRQLETCMIYCSRKDKETGAVEWGSFRIISKAWWSSPSGSKKDISRFTLRLDDDLIKNLNNFHYARFNWYRLRQLMEAPIAMILYKRFFQTFASLMDEQGNPTVSVFEKDYQDVCRYWLGGLKPERYAAHIRKQLGRHIQAVHDSRLGRISVEKRKKGSGFKLVFKPKKGFFDDYQSLYVDPVRRPRLPFNRLSDHRNIEEPLMLVAYFYRELGQDKSNFRDSEVQCADELLKRLSYSEMEDLIDVVVRHAKQKGFDPYSFTLVNKYVDRWTDKRDRRLATKTRNDAIAACDLCDQNGFFTLIDPGDVRRAVTYECPHDKEAVSRTEREKGLKRV